MKRRGIFSWCLYNTACSAYSTVIQTFIFGVYFAKSVAPEGQGTALWSETLTIAGLLVAILSPILGAVADQAGRRKPWIAAFTLLLAASTLALFFVKPDPAFVPLALTATIISAVSFELANVFYNAMLPRLSGAPMIGRVSGWGKGCGYAGGLLCLALCLFGLVKTSHPLFGLVSTENAANIRACALVVAVWTLLFAAPLFFYTQDEPNRGLGSLQAIKQGMASLWQTLRHVRRYGEIVRFLIASALFRDGLNTLFAFAGIYASHAFGWDISQVIIFAIGANVLAGIGAALFAFVDDAIGPRFTIMVSLGGLLLFGIPAVLATTPLWFWVFGLGLGIFVGPVQAAGRSLLAHLAPPHMEAEIFGLYTLSGEATSFLGPAMLGWATVHYGDRAGMGTILLFFAFSLALMRLVKEPPHSVAT